MVIRVFTFRVGLGRKEHIERVAKKALPLFKAAKGCEWVYFVEDENNGEYGAISLWKSKEDLYEFLQSSQFDHIHEAVDSVGARHDVVEKMFQVYET